MSVVLNLITEVFLGEDYCLLIYQIVVHGARMG